MRKAVVLISVLILVVGVTGSGLATSFSGKKVLYVDSYHEGYGWSDGITEGVQKGLEGTGVTLKILRMDTKRNKGEDFKQAAAETARDVIESFRPDVVIAADDNASKYLIVPYYKDGAIPFVFCGVNWDASGYGFPCSNVTGMVEVSPIPELLKQLAQYAAGDRIGYIAGDVLSARKEGENYKKIFNLDLVEVYVGDFAAWKDGFARLQEEVDMLIVGNNAGINDWDEDDAVAFVQQKTRIPTGTAYDFVAPYAMFGFTKVAQEQGHWAALAAVDILGGKNVAAIPIAKNEQGKLIVNSRLVSALGIDVPYEVFESADQVIE